MHRIPFHAAAPHQEEEPLAAVLAFAFHARHRGWHGEDAQGFAPGEHRWQAPGLAGLRPAL